MTSGKFKINTAYIYYFRRSDNAHKYGAAELITDEDAQPVVGYILRKDDDDLNNKVKER